MPFPEYGTYDATGLAELVRTKQVHPRELVDEAIRRIDAGNPMLNAVIHRVDASARKAAEGPLTGPFAGVPFLAKDLLSTWAGVPQASGTQLLRGWVPDHDSELAARFKRTGIVLVGKTNTPEFGLLPVTEPKAFGASRNPWLPGRTPGGSSGGSAAAVAAGFVPMASGGDGGGSIRIPASCCGLFGLKPTRGRTPVGPDIGEAWLGCAIEHVLTRSVRDSAAMLDATHGADPGAPYFAPPVARPFLAEVGAAPGRLKIAMTAKALIPADVDPACVRAVEDAAALLRSLGHEVIEDHPIFDAAQFALDFVTMLVGEVAADVAQFEALAGRKARTGDLEKETRVLAKLGESVSAGEFALAARRIRLISRRLAGFFATYDLLLTPTLAKPPIEIGALNKQGAEEMMMRVAERLPIAGLLRRFGAIQRIATEAWAFTPFTAVWNATGQPGCNLPLFWEGGLPIGVQLVGRFGDEATLLRVAAQVEAARPWAARRPPGF
jgi:amidase